MNLKGEIFNKEYEQKISHATLLNIYLVKEHWQYKHVNLMMMSYVLIKTVVVIVNEL